MNYVIYDTSHKAFYKAPMNGVTEDIEEAHEFSTTNPDEARKCFAFNTMPTFVNDSDMTSRFIKIFTSDNPLEMLMLNIYEHTQNSLVFDSRVGQYWGDRERTLVDSATEAFIFTKDQLGETLQALGKENMSSLVFTIPLDLSDEYINATCNVEENPLSGFLDFLKGLRGDETPGLGFDIEGGSERPVDSLTETPPPFGIDLGEAERITPIEMPLEEGEEYTGSSVSYYTVEIDKPTKLEVPYVCECNDIVEALGMNFAEGNAFKAIWRSCAARQFGLQKKGYDAGLYDAEKVVFFGERMVELAKKNQN